MNPLIATTLADLASSVIKKFFPNTNEEKMALIKLEIEQQAQKNELLKAQLAVNQAEAANPNRKYPTWRECLGYLCVLVVGYNLVIRNVINDLAQLAGFKNVLEPMDISQLFKLLLAMLGIGS